MGPRLLLSLGLLLTPLLRLLAAELPDDAAGAELAVKAGVGAGPAVVQALLAVGDLHFLAEDTGVPVRVMAAFIHKFHIYTISKTAVGSNEAGKESHGLLATLAGRGHDPASPESPLSLLQKSHFCHPERSEGSQPSENTRIFATLRMTMVVHGEFCKKLH
jgi:hypothetical protein